jgi:integrase
LDIREMAEMVASKITKAVQVDSFGPGSYSAAPNLILRVKPTGARSWVFRYQSGGKVAEVGLGKAGTKERGLAEARDLAEKMRAAVRNGMDPKTVLKPKHDPTAMTFKAYADHYIEHLRGTARNGKARNSKAVEQWPSTLAKWVYPHIGDKRPAEITYRDVQSVLTRKGLADLPETQKRVRQRIKVILDEAAKEENEPHRYNPALSFQLDRRPHDSVKHHAAAPWADVPAIVAKLRARDSTSSMLLRFSILTAARSGEARGAMWAEIDLDAATWIIPADRMKARRLHRVPLCPEALEILKVMAERKHERVPERVFPGALGGLISDVAVAKTLRLAAKDAEVDAHATPHGFRSSFRQWGAEATGFSPEALELALAHTPKDKVQAAYQRSDLFDTRIIIMKAWADYIAGKSNIVQIASTA